jgi:hypothetical protein
VTQSDVGRTVWSLDALSGYSAGGELDISKGSFGTLYARVRSSQAGAWFHSETNALGAIVNGNLSWYNMITLGNGNPTLGVNSGYFGFRDTKGGTPIYGWVRWTTTTSNTLTLNEWYYNDTPGGSIVVGDKGSSTAVPFDFNPLQGAALGVPIFIGLRQLKRRKAKLNTMVSVKGKEKIHPLALIGMGAAGVLKWRAQKDKDAA